MIKLKLKKIYSSLPDIITEYSDVIEHLILDGNQLTECALEDIPRLEHLQSLSLNSNKVLIKYYK